MVGVYIRSRQGVACTNWCSPNLHHSAISLVFVCVCVFVCLFVCDLVTLPHGTMSWSVTISWLYTNQIIKIFVDLGLMYSILELTHSTLRCLYVSLPTRRNKNKDKRKKTHTQTRRYQKANNLCLYYVISATRFWTHMPDRTSIDHDTRICLATNQMLVLCKCKMYYKSLVRKCR